MDLPEFESIKETAIDLVASVVNRAKEQLGERQTLKQLVLCREFVAGDAKRSVAGQFQAPLAITAEKIIKDTIRHQWKLLEYFKVALDYKNGSRDETSHYYYYEAIFSQPTNKYPIPQATASVYFRVQERYTEPPRHAPIPVVEYMIEGSRQVHDIRFVTLVPEWLLALIKMKIILYQRIEEYSLF